MRGDTIVVEAHHRKAADGVAAILLPRLEETPGRHTLSIAGESGSGKSETAVALAERLSENGISSVIFQQDDYFINPPKSNDAVRRKDIAWVGPGEVRLDLLDAHLEAFLDGAAEIEKPLVVYEDDAVTREIMGLDDARIAIAEGTYTTLLDSALTHVFIDRSYRETRAHREKRKRDAAELDPFIDKVLEIEHAIISAHKPRAQIIIDGNYVAAAAD